MIAIADAGGTKTDWRFIQDGKVTQLVTAGYNARTDADSLGFIHDISELSRVSHIYFYAAGVNDQNTEAIRNQLANKLPSEASIEVFPDTLAVARGLQSSTPGWVGILGTGSAALFYDGFTIANRRPSLGYLLGDEGSGFDIGKSFINSYLRGDFGALVQRLIEKQYPELTESFVLDQVYHQQTAKSYVSSFVPFLAQHQTQPEIYHLIEKAFESYFESFFKQDKPESISFSGSVAFHFGNILNAVAKKQSIRINKIIQSPIAGLTLYHQQNG